MEILSLEWKMSSIFHSAGYCTYCLIDRAVVRGGVQDILLHASADADSWKEKANKGNLLFVLYYTTRMAVTDYSSENPMNSHREGIMSLS